MGKNIYRKRRNEAIFCIIVDSIFIIAGIPLIVIGAINQFWWLFGIAILAMAFAFLTLPFVSIMSHRIFICKQTYKLVTIDNIFNINELAKIENKSVDEIKKELSILINLRCLFGYYIDYNHNLINKTNHYK